MSFRFVLTALAFSACTVITDPGSFEGGVDGGTPPTSCAGDLDCSDGVCDTSVSICVECRVEEDACAADQECVAGECVPVESRCGDGPACPPGLPCRSIGDAYSCASCSEEVGCAGDDICVADRCVGCAPATDCTSSQICVPGPPDVCQECDVDGMDGPGYHPRCEAIGAPTDCDDDDDGFCHPNPACSGSCLADELDCDDTRNNVQPGLLSCDASPLLQSCVDAANVFPSGGRVSMTVMRVASRARPTMERSREPISLLHDASFGSNRWHVVYLDDESPSGRFERMRRVEADVATHVLTVGDDPVSASPSAQFLDARSIFTRGRWVLGSARHAGGAAGSVVTLGTALALAERSARSRYRWRRYLRAWL